MKPSPKGWPRISVSLFYDDAATAIDWLCTAFDFDVQLKVEGEGGRIEHSQLVYGEGLIMVSSTGRDDRSHSFVSPASQDGKVTQSLCIFVDDVDAHCERARSAGATIGDEPKTTDYGEDYWTDRGYRAVDPEGPHWWFMQRLRG